MSEIIRMIPKASTIAGDIRSILDHLKDVPQEERSLIANAGLKEILFEPAVATITIVMDLPAVLTDESVNRIEMAAVDAIPGMRIRIERVAVGEVIPPEQNDPLHVPIQSAANDVTVIGSDEMLSAWPDLLASLKKQVPASSPWLLSSRPCLEKGTLVVDCANELAVAQLVSLRCGTVLSNLVRERWNASMETTFRNAQIALPPPKPVELSPAPQKKERDRVLLGSSRGVKGAATLLRDVTSATRQVIVEGELFRIELREGRKSILTMNITDYTDSIKLKIFDPPDTARGALDGDYVRVSGRVEADTFERGELVMTPRDIVLFPREMPLDVAEEKRIELNLHTKFSRLSGMIDIDAYFARLKSWGWPGAVVTDDAVVQAFPKFHAAAKKAGLKAGLGCQINYVDNQKPIAWNLRPTGKRPGGRTAKVEDKDVPLSGTAVVFDLETTGIGAISNKVIEIAAYRVERNMITDEFKSFVNPGETLSSIIKSITHITDEMLVGAPEWPDVLARFREFAGDAYLVAHNISFDAGFLRRDWPKKSEMPPLVDTLGMARALLPTLSKFPLGTIAKALNVPLVEAHRATDDARALAKIFLELRALAKEQGVETLSALNGMRGRIEARKLHPQDVTVLVKEQHGLKNLYKLVTSAHMEHLYMRPRTPATVFEAHRDGLIAGSGAVDGPVAEAILSGEDPALIDELARRFDYLEVGPPALYDQKRAEGILRSDEEVREFIRTMIAVARRTDRPVVGVSRAHHLDPRDHKARKILLADKRNRSENIPSLHLRSTAEMLAEFAFLGEEEARRIVIETPRAIFDSLEPVSPLPKGFFPPIIDGAAEELRAHTMKGATELYAGEDGTLPELVGKSIEKELNAIIGNGFAVLYLIAMRLCISSRAAGYVVGSRGSVGSSIVAFLTGITEVNPLPPHYRCLVCRRTEFVEPGPGTGAAGSGPGACGPDLKKKECCGGLMVRDGYRIPFEAFMGLDGTKVPDIDLNFAGEYQAKAMAEIESTFGKEHVFRAGTISTLKERNAAGFVLKYLEEHALTWRRAEVERFARSITEVARTTGQHPGGIVIIPRDKEMSDFMPVHRPADSESADNVTTHFDFHSYEGTVVKVDVLGHDAPSAVRMLLESTGVDPMTVPIDDPGVLSLFSSPKALGLTESRLGYPVGTLGIPEFGTSLLLNILRETRPTTIEELIRISGLSHGTGVWQGNAQDIIRAGTAKLSEVIATREDIMNELVKRSVDPVKAFAIMEKVRKGKGLAPEDEQLMRKHKVATWVIESLRQIKYMFPKAHAVAYVLMALRIAWFKVHRPEAFYAAYFSLKVGDFALDVAMQGEKAVAKHLAEIRQRQDERKATAKEESQAVVLDIVREMYARGIALQPVSIADSDLVRFKPSASAVRAPLLAVEGLGEKVARRVGEELAAGASTIEDLVDRSGISRPIMERLRKYGAFGDLPESNQLVLF